MKNIEQEIRSLDWSKEPAGLYAPIGYTLEAGGKRLRPQLCMLGCSLFDKAAEAEEDALAAALGLEIFHNFTLLHDDVMDHSRLRRGRETVWVHWDENTAILSGDQMTIEAYKQIAKVSETKLAKVLKMFNQMATEICEGQQMDMDFETRDDVTVEEYIQMIAYKTAVLPATALKIGAYIGGASEEEQEAAYRFGYEIGLAFQIQDDILDVYGDEKTFGKPIGGDIREGKKTLLRLYAEQQEKIESREYAIVRAQYDRLGVREKCEAQMRAYTDAALSRLAQLPDGEAKTQLYALAEKLMKRES